MFHRDLDFRDSVGMLIKGVLARKLQAQQTAGKYEGVCSYTGPCAIGYILGPDDSRRLDGLAHNEIGQQVIDEWREDRDEDDDRSPSLDTDIDSLLTYKLIEVPDNQEAHWRDLQRYHDALVTYRTRINSIRNNIAIHGWDEDIEATLQAAILAAHRERRHFFQLLRTLISLYA